LEGLLQPPSKFAVRSGRIQAELVQDENIIGAINTSYTVGAVVAGFFFGGPLADWAGRRMGMAAGAVLVIIATFMQCFAPRGNIGVFIAGRVVIGLGQGLALSKQFLHYHESSD
jgi:MFS family permease